jgi:3-keto-disaccharide hydrolase
MWFTILSREGNKFKGRLLGETRAELIVEGTLGEDGTSFRWTNFRHKPNVWRSQQEFESFTAEGKCLAERTRVDFKYTKVDGLKVEGNCEFTVRRDSTQKVDEDVWPPMLHPRRSGPPRGKWSVQGDELVQEDSDEAAWIIFGDIGWKDYDFHLKAMKTAGDDGFRIHFDDLRPRNATQLCIGIGPNRQTGVELIEYLPTGNKYAWLSELKAGAIVDNQWYDILIKTRGQWIECILDGKRVFKIPRPDRWGGKVGFVCLKMAARFKDIEVTDPNGKILWKKGPPELP